MARIKKKPVDEFYTDIATHALRNFREHEKSIDEMCNIGYGHLLTDPNEPKIQSDTFNYSFFSEGRYIDSKNNIFISDNVLQLLQRSSFDNTPDAKIRLPFKTFKIRFPTPSGLGACIFTTTRSSIIRFLGGGQLSIDNSKKNEAYVITTTYITHKGKSLKSSTIHTVDNLLADLKTESDASDKVKTTRDLAVKFCILYSTGAISMEDGHPLPTKYDKPKQGGKSFRFGFNNAEFNNEAFVRPHFRNLRDERYYKKEPYNEWERGSRWTFVTGKTINAKSYTATNTTT